MGLHDEIYRVEAFLYKLEELNGVSSDPHYFGQVSPTKSLFSFVSVWSFFSVFTGMFKIQFLL